MEVVLKDNGLKDYFNKDVPKSDAIDTANLDAWKKKVAKARRILLEGVRDHIVSSLHGKTTPHAMWKVLTDLFQNNSDHRKLALKDKLGKIKVEKGDTIPKYLMKFFQCRDELGSVGITIVVDDLVSLALLGLPKSWHSYQDSINGREKLPYWEQLWLNLVQEEFKRNTRDGSSSKCDDEEDCALTAKASKGKGKKFHSKSESKVKKLDLSKVKCFHCHKHGHLATNCPQKRKNKTVVEAATGEAQLDQCKGCTLGKYVKSTFHEKENRASVILERIHRDVCGPFLVASIEKHKYYVIFFYDFSRKCWIFFMQKKDQTFSKFCEFKALVEKESRKQVKALRSDNGGE
jgi:hypothetical protein